ncbi:MAG: ATP-binding cassette domain-containing protein [Oscillospiraceae bacterium]|jgi:D-methionine transport system ATP-binding protein|nr:ATP-binding cassette domain-containing protein [Oscillospiraceae bacterium]
MSEPGVSAENIQPYIEIKNLTKSFKVKEGRLEVLKGISLSVPKGDVFGIIGLSGAGKSTLARCINRLEAPDSGSVIIGGVDVLSLSKSQLRAQRQRIGMIFQTFNLFEAKTVYKNIAFPLAVRGLKSADRDKRVKEIAEIVGLQDKLNVYPGGLSGGQKQRVGIARALANSPDILLSDEATSALDPQTTLSILELLKDINKNLGLTILLITHELDVIKYTTKNMAVLEDGVISETGRTSDIFANPNSSTGKIFLKVYSELQDSYVEGGGGI